jgi:hypothetical protein
MVSGAAATGFNSSPCTPASSSTRFLGFAPLATTTGKIGNIELVNHWHTLDRVPGKYHYCNKAL